MPKAAPLRTLSKRAEERRRVGEFVRAGWTLEQIAEKFPFVAPQRGRRHPNRRHRDRR